MDPVLGLAMALKLARIGMEAAELFQTDNPEEAQKKLEESREVYARGVAAWEAAGED